MEILNRVSGIVCDYEVLAILKNIDPPENPYEVAQGQRPHHSLQWLKSAITRRFKDTHVRETTPDHAQNLVNALSSVNLTPAELAMVINQRPKSVIHVMQIVERFDERFTPEQGLYIVNAALQCLPAPPERKSKYVPDQIEAEPLMEHKKKTFLMEEEIMQLGAAEPADIDGIE